MVDVGLGNGIEDTDGLRGSGVFFVYLANENNIVVKVTVKEKYIDAVVGFLSGNCCFYIKNVLGVI